MRTTLTSSDSGALARLIQSVFAASLRSALHKQTTLTNIPSIIRSNARGHRFRGGFVCGLAGICLAFTPLARAVSPPPDGGYEGFNTAEGDNALFSLTTGLDNTAIGSAALVSDTTGSDNTATGENALGANTTGNRNTGNGVGALFNNTIGFDNTATGYRALLGNTTGQFNTANGSNALLANTTGFFNTATGFNTLENNTTGGANTASGDDALSGNTTGSDNTANGSFALASNTTGNNSTATGLNALISNTSGSSNTADGAAMTDLSTLGGSGSRATGINDSGQVVGYAYTANDAAVHAFLYFNGVMSDLGTLPGGSYSSASGINDLGQVVGSDFIEAANENHAFFYSGGTMYDLNNLIPADSGWILERASAINEVGQICGYGLHDGLSRAFLATPVGMVSVQMMRGASDNVFVNQGGGVDEPLVPTANPGILVSQPSVSEGVAEDGVTPLLFKFEQSAPAQASYTVTVDVPALTAHLHVSVAGGWGSGNTVSFDGLNSDQFAYIDGLAPEAVIPTGQTEVVAALTLTNTTDPNDVVTQYFRVRRPPIVLVHGYASSSSTWGSDFLNALAAATPFDFIRAIDYGVVGEPSLNTYASFAELVPLHSGDAQSGRLYRYRHRQEQHGGRCLG